MNSLNAFSILPFSSLAIALLAIGLGTLSFSSAAQAQSGTSIGLDLRIHQVSHSGGFRTLNSLLPLFENGSGFGQSVGLKLRHRASSSWRVSGALIYNNLPGRFEQHIRNPQGNDLAITSAEGIPITDETERTVLLASDVSYSTLSLEALGEWFPFAEEGSWSIGVAAGPTLSYRLEGTLEQSATVVDPANVRFENPNQFPAKDNGKTILFYDGDLVEPNNVLAGLEGGVFAEFEQLIPGVILSPGIFYHYGLASVTKAETWRLHTLTGQLSLMMKL